MANAEPASRKLPVDDATLSAINALRDVQEPPERCARAAAVVAALRAAGSPALRTDAEDVAYVLRRLCTGVASSVGGARTGMALALSDLTCAVISDASVTDRSPADAFAEVVGAVARVYGSEGDFSADYASGDRERALGTVAACAAVVASLKALDVELGSTRPAKKPKTAAIFSAHSKSVKSRAGDGSCKGVVRGQAAREIVLMLRGSAFANQGKWALGCSAVAVLQEFLPYVEHGAFDKQLEKPLLKWCKDHAKLPDGLALSLLLFVECGAVNSEAFGNLYPSREALYCALISCFEQGFPLWNEYDDDVSMTEAEPLLHERLVPLQWNLALKLVALPAVGAPTWGSQKEFWDECVCSKLIKGSESKDKKTLAIAMLPLAVESCADVEAFSALLNADLGSLVGSLSARRPSSRRGRGVSTAGPAVRRRKEDAGSYSRLTEAASGLGLAVLHAIRQKQRSGLKHAGAWVQCFVSWAIRARVATELLKSESFKFALALMSANEVDDLFRMVVHLFAEPRCESRDVVSQRADAVHVLFNFAHSREELSFDVAQVFALYSMFSPGVASSADVASRETTSGEMGGCSVRSDQLRSDVMRVKAMIRHRPKNAYRSSHADLTFAGLVPAPVPEISTSTAHRMFRRLIELLMDGKRALLEPLFTFAQRLSVEKTYFSVNLREVDDTMTPSVESMQCLIDTIGANASSHPVARAISMLSQFLFLLIHDVPPGMCSKGEYDIPPVVFSNAISQMKKCLEALHLEEDNVNCLTLPSLTVPGPKDGESGGNQDVNDESDGEGGRPPTALEQITYIIATLCQQHSAVLRRVASFTFDVIGDIANDTVSAVIFDLLGSPETGEVLDGIKSDDDEGENDESENEEGEDDDVEDGGSESGPAREESVDNGLDDKRNGSISRKRMSLERSRRGNDNISEDIRAQKNQLRDNRPPSEGAGKKSGQEEDSDETECDPMDMLVDDEDPEMLEAYDRHLSNHMQLLKVDKARSKRARLRSTRISSSTGRLLDLVELLARRFRLRLANTADPASERDVTYSFLDLIVRITEFLYENDDSGSLTHLSRVVGIFHKHLDRPLSAFTGRSMRESRGDLVERFFNAVEEPDIKRRAGAAEMRMVAHAASILTFATQQDQEQFELASTGYKRAWKQFCAPGNKFWGSTMFSSAVSRVPDLAKPLIELTVGSILDQSTSCRTRKHALQTMHTYISAVRDLKDLGSEAYPCFWDGARVILLQGSSGELAPKLWKHGVGVEELLRLLEVGLSSSDIQPDDGICSAVGSLLASINHKVPRKVDKRLKKSENAILKLSGVVK